MKEGNITKRADFFSSKEELKNFLDYCRKCHPEVIRVLYRYELSQMDSRLQLAIDQAGAASKKYYEQEQKMYTILREQGAVEAGKLLDETNRLEKEMKKADRLVRKLEKQMDDLRETL